ncbi:MAG: ABC transporter substrate-binding protein [Candidatus Thorarchaeota archaeon]|jgi:ABC-type transport system substrate-binding protein
MGIINNRRFLAVAFVAVFVFMAASPILPLNAVDKPSDLNIGPHVNRVTFKENSDSNSRILNLRAGTTDIVSAFSNSSVISELEAEPDISVARIPRNGYGHISINCDKYPLNISAFRRAFAYAFDKTRVTAEILNGFSQEHDSVVPYSNSWCIEDDLQYHYYTGQAATGAAILDAAGFTIDPDTGYRLAPDGSPFLVFIECPFESSIAFDVSMIGYDALIALNILANVSLNSFDNIMTRIDNNEDYDMAFYAYDFPSNDVDWLAYTFWGELSDLPNTNPCNFRNATYDSWRDQLLHSTDYEEVYEAAAEMQMILHENVPLVVAYENIYMQAYRTDPYAGHIEDLGRGIAGTWTLRNIHRFDGFPEDWILIETDDIPDTFNIYRASTFYEESIITELFPRLYLRGPDLQPWPHLAEHLLIETHRDNPSVPKDYTRFKVDIVQNATWSDGAALTAEDVVFTFKYAFESGVHGNPAAASLTDLVAVYAPTPYRVVFEFRTESFWHFSSFAYNYIIPRHIFNNVDGIGYEGWNTWDPVINSTHPFVTAGPFELTMYIPDDRIEITSNPDFWYYPQERVTAMAAPLFNAALVLLVGGVGAAVVTLNILIRRKSS